MIRCSALSDIGRKRKAKPDRHVHCDHRVRTAGDTGGDDRVTAERVEHRT